MKSEFCAIADEGEIRRGKAGSRRRDMLKQYHSLQSINRIGDWGWGSVSKSRPRLTIS